MSRFNSSRVLITLLALVFCGCATLLVLLPTKSKPLESVSTNEEQAKPVRDLEELHQKYARVQSVHLIATAKISVFADGLREGAGSFEYWADDNRYRTNCRTDPKLELLGDIDMAYDGGRFYYFDRKLAVLSHRTQDEEKSFSALPNPFFLPVEFFSNDTDECVFCRLRLKDFKARSTRWDKQKDKLSVRSKGKGQSTSLDFIEVELPSAIIDKKGSKFRLQITAGANGVTQPNKIERLQLDDRPLTSIVLSDYFSTVAGDFPRRIQIQEFDEQATVVMKVDYYIETLEVNQPIDSAVFTIRENEAEAVWDSDQKKFMKEKPAKKKPQ